MRGATSPKKQNAHRTRAPPRAERPEQCGRCQDAKIGHIKIIRVLPKSRAVCPATSGASSVLKCAILVVFDAAGNCEHVQQGLLQRRPRQDQVHVVGPLLLALVGADERHALVLTGVRRGRGRGAAQCQGQCQCQGWARARVSGQGCALLI